MEKIRRPHFKLSREKKCRPLLPNFSYSTNTKPKKICSTKIALEKWFTVFFYNGVALIEKKNDTTKMHMNIFISTLSETERVSIPELIHFCCWWWHFKFYNIIQFCMCNFPSHFRWVSITFPHELEQIGSWWFWGNKKNHMSNL